MKIIISHDIDHITFWEHYKDLIIPKFFVRNHIELFKGKISWKEYLRRYQIVFGNQWQNIDSLIDFNESMGVKSSFFIGVENGKGLSYSMRNTKTWIPKILARNCELGVHGIAYEDLISIKKEYNRFESVSNMEEFGFRMHYLRQNDCTHKNLERVGYLFDATETGYKNPYKIGNMWEFPIQIMDCWIVNRNGRYQKVNLEEAKELTIKKLKLAKEQNLTHLSILFHDCYFSDKYVTWKEWYKWLVSYLKEQGYEFVTYQEAIKGLEQ